MYNIDIIKKDLKQKLSKYRYNHSLNVAEVCMELAKIYGIDKEKAYLTGLVHDIAKEFPKEENEYYLKKYNLPNLDEEYKSIIHSYVGAAYLKEKYNIDKEIYNAITKHTLASLDMTTLDKILFIADKIEPGKNYPNIEKERQLAKINLDKTLTLCLENNYQKLTSEGKKMHPTSLEVLNNLKTK